jgi:arabinofuranosyltransferase
LCYYANSLRRDPVTLVLIGLGMSAPWLARRWHEAALALGIALYLVYIVKIGGDYMSGRFFTGPLVLAVVLVCRTPWAQRPALALPWVLALMGLSLMMPRSPLRSGSDFGTARLETEVDRRGISDERGYFYGRLGLLRIWEIQGQGRVPRVLALEEERRRQREEPAGVQILNTFGRNAFRLAARAHVIDACALGDAFLARMPMKEGPWRVGHYFRQVPTGYADTVQTGMDRFADRNLGAYYAKLKRIISGELWSAERWRAIWEINTGQLDHLIDAAHYRRTGDPPGERGALAP